MPDLQKPTTTSPPPTRLEDLHTIPDHVEAARIAHAWAQYARMRERAALRARDERIRAARAARIPQPTIAAGVGVSVATVRVVTRP